MLLEDDPVVDPAPVAAQQVSRIGFGALGQQRGELVPQRLGQPRWQHKHRSPMFTERQQLHAHGTCA
ncbi:hypothetical protein [Streptomyces decoyicus]